jgi:FkbM family methyltransferase
MKIPCKSLLLNSPLGRVMGPLIQWRRDRLAREQFWRITEADQLRAGFYSRFMKAGDLVFDIGANVGERSKAFLMAGASVVAVEPQKRCAEALRVHFRNRREFRVVECALGAEPGEAEMRIASSSTMSSLSKDWIRSVTESHRMGGTKWDRTELVPVRTLDALIAEYGVPQFAKVDVEGYENEVLKGLSRPIPAMSLEFTPEYFRAIEECVQRLCLLGTPRFQISLGESMQFHLSAWVEGDRILDELKRVARDAFGDLYVNFEDGR